MILHVLSIAFKAIDAGRSMVLCVPGYKLCEGIVLDTLLGPEEDFDYVSTTAPSSPPPTHP